MRSCAESYWITLKRFSASSLRSKTECWKSSSTRRAIAKRQAIQSAGQPASAGRKGPHVMGFRAAHEFSFVAGDSPPIPDHGVYSGGVNPCHTRSEERRVGEE